MSKVVFTLIAAGFLASSPLHANSQTLQEKRKAVMPSVSAATDCFAREAMKYPGYAEMDILGRAKDALKEIEKLCLPEIKTMEDEYDKAMLPGSSTIFYNSEYFKDLPRAVRARIEKTGIIMSPDGMVFHPRETSGRLSITGDTKSASTAAPSAPKTDAAQIKTATPITDSLVESPCELPTLFPSLEKIVSPKSEFESTEDYKNKILASMKSADIPENQFCSLQRPNLLRYDADKGGYDLSYISLSVSMPDIPDGVFEGSNSFGVKTNVQKIKSERYSLSFGSYSDSIHGSAFIHMAKDQARMVDSDLRLGVYFSLKMPIAKTGYYNTKPTIDIPIEYEVTEHNIYSEPIRIVLFNAATKNVIWWSNITKCKQSYSDTYYFTLNTCGPL